MQQRLITAITIAVILVLLWMCGPVGTAHLFRGVGAWIGTFLNNIK